jgi:hypothetical protein
MHRSNVGRKEKPKKLDFNIFDVRDDQFGFLKRRTNFKLEKILKEIVKSSAVGHTTHTN